MRSDLEAAFRCMAENRVAGRSVGIVMHINATLWIEGHFQKRGVNEHQDVEKNLKLPTHTNKLIESKQNRTAKNINNQHRQTAKHSNKKETTPPPILHSNDSTK